MGTNTLKSNNIQFPIYNEDGAPFEGLVLRKATYDSVVMSLGDKITGEVVYKDNTLAVTMHEYIEFKNDPDDENEDPVRFSLVNPPTIIREGLVKDNSDLKGMTKYSFEFYHPMYQLSNMPFSDVAVSSDERKYLSENKTFGWIGKPQDYIDKLNKNLQGTEWVVVMSSRFPQDKANTLSEVLSFDNNTIADALKTAYDAWEVPYIVDTVRPNEYSYIDEHNVQRDYYDDGKRFVVVFGLPSNEIYASEADRQTGNKFVFKMGQGVGLKNNSRNPRNNKIITRIAGSGSENNIPYGYPQIVWYGNQNWDYTINNNPSDPHSYPIYKGIVGGRYVKLIKHPFTRKNLMPSVYSRSVFNKVSPYNPWSGNVPSYNQTLWQLKQRIQSQYSQESTTVEIEAYETLLEKLDEAAAKTSGSVDFSGTQFEGSIYNNGEGLLNGYLQINEDPIIEFEFESVLIESKFETNNPSYDPNATLIDYYDAVASQEYPYHNEINLLAPSYEFHKFEDIKPEMDDGQSNVKILGATPLNNDLTPADSWDDTIDNDGKFVQSYFSVDLPVLSFDIYACAAITQEMQINMRGGACIGCTFTIQVDWDDYKKNFYDAKGNFDPNIGEGHPRDAEKYPDSSTEAITVICQKETQTFGTLMPNRYKYPQANDEFVVLGISLPIEYIENAEARLDREMKSYMLENNVYYYDYPLKFDEYFLVNHKNILRQLKPNTIVRFEFAKEELQLFVKQLSIKYGESPLPQYNITLTDNIEVVLNQIGQVAEDVERLGSLISIMRQSYGNNVYAQIASKLSKRDDDTAAGLITFLKGVLFGNSGLWGIDGNGDGVLRNLNVEKLEAKVAHFFELIIDKIRSVGGRIVVTAANAEITRVVEVYNSDDEPKLIGWKCYWPNTDGDKTIRNEFVAGDQVMCASFNEAQTGESQNVGNKYYWRLCKASGVENGENFVFLSDADGEKATIIQGVPEVGDNLVLMGYNDAWREAHQEESASDFAERQAAIVLSAYNNAWLKPSDVQREIKAPCYVQYEGINSFDIVASNIVTVISPSGNEFKGTFRVVSGADIEKVGRIVYKSSTTRPETPTGTTIPPDGWSMEPKEEYATLPFTLSYSGDWTNIGNGEWKSNQISDQQVTRERVTFQTTGDAVIYVRLTSDSEAYLEDNEWYDIIGVGNVDVDMSWAGYDDLGDGNDPDYFAGRCAGQENSVVVQLKVTGAGQHFFDVLYWKDSSQSVGGDYGTFKVLGGDILPIWASVFDGIGTWSVPVRWNGTDGSDGKSGQDGTSPIVVDLSNEMDAVACNADGEVTAEQSVTTTVRPYKGTTALSITNIAVKIGEETIGTSYGSDEAKDSYYIKATTNTTTGAVTVYFRQGYTMSTPAEVSIVVTCDGKEYTLTLTVTGMRPGADGTPATIYNLKPNPTAIKTAQVSGGYSPATASVVCGYTKNVGGSIETVMDVTGRIDTKYNVYFRLRKRADRSYTIYYLYYITNNKTVLANLELTTYDAVEFILCTDTATTIQSPTGVIDRETVPVVADGLQGSEGEDAVVYKLTPIVEQALVDKDKKLTLSLNYQLWKYTGNTGTQVSFEGFNVYCKVGNTTTEEYKWIGATGNTISLNKQTVTGYSGNPLYYTVELYYINGNNEVLVDRRIVQVSMSAKVVFEVGEDAVTSAVANISNVKNYFGFNRGVKAYNPVLWSYSVQSGTWVYDNGDTPATTVNNAKMRVTFTGAKTFSIVLNIQGGSTSDKLYLGNINSPVSTSSYNSVRSGSGQMVVTLSTTSTGSNYFEVLYVKSSSSRAYFDIREQSSYRAQLWPAGYGFIGYGRYSRLDHLGMDSKDQNQPWTLYCEVLSLSAESHSVRPFLCNTAPSRINGVSNNNSLSISNSKWSTFVCEWDSVNNSVIDGVYDGVLEFRQDYNTYTLRFAVRNVCLTKELKPYLRFVTAEEDINYMGGLQSFDWNIMSYCVVDGQTFMGMKVYRNSTIVDNVSANYIDLIDYGDGSSSFSVRDGQPYTLSFWAKASKQNASIVSYLYNSYWSLFRPLGVEQMSSGGGEWKTVLTTEWKRYTVHWVPNLEQAARQNSEQSRKLNKIILAARIVKSDTNNLGAYIYLSGLTFQEGWVEDGQSTVAFQTSEIKQTADKISSTVQELQGTVNGHSERITTVEQTADGLKTTVNNMKVGGRNLILNGAFNYDSRYWSDWGSPSKREIVSIGGRKWMHIITTADSYQGYSQNRFDKGIIIRPNTKYTVSFLAYRANNSSISDWNISVGIHWLENGTSTAISQNWYHQFLLETTPKLYSYTFTSSDDSRVNSFSLMIGQGSSHRASGREFYITNIQLEEGTMATDWRESIEENHSLIDQTADNIKLEVEGELGECGIDITQNKITLNGNTEVNGMLTLNDDTQGFKVTGNGGNTYITPKTIGAESAWSNRAAIDITCTRRVSEVVVEDTQYYQGVFTSTNSFGYAKSGSQLILKNHSLSFQQKGYSPIKPVTSGTTKTYTKYYIYIGSSTTPTEVTVNGTTASSITTFTISSGGNVKVIQEVHGVFRKQDIHTSSSQSSLASIPEMVCTQSYVATMPTGTVESVIGYDGLGVNFGNGKYVYIGQESAVFKFGDNGLKVTANGLQKLSGGVWVGLNTLNVVTVSSGTTLTGNEDFVLYNGSSSGQRIKLPSASSFKGKVIYIKSVASSNVEIYGNIRKQTSDTASWQPIEIGKEAHFVISDGDAWNWFWCS